MAKFEITWLEDASDQGLLNEIRRVAAMFSSKRLDIETFDAYSKISSSAIGRRFGSWSKATRLANLGDALPDYSDDAILSDLKSVSQAYPKEPFTNAFYLSHGGRYSRSIFKRRFGGWREALHSAGIANRYAGKPTTDRMKTQPGRHLSNEDILAEIRNVAARLGKGTLTSADIRAHSQINLGLLAGRFGGVSAALGLAGIGQVAHGRRHAEDEIFENLLKVWIHYGRPPTHSEMDKPPSSVGSNTYIKRYGGWRNALKAFAQRANTDVSSPAQIVFNQKRAQVVSPNTKSSTAASSTSEAVDPRPGRRSRTARSQQAATDGSLTAADRRDPSIGLRFKVLQRDHFRCRLCGRSPATDISCNLHVDHIVAFSKGGKTILENLQTLCSHCNVGKGSKPL